MTEAKNMNSCRACAGSGLQSEDEGWKYPCAVCHGDGQINAGDTADNNRRIDYDDNNRVID